MRPDQPPVIVVGASRGLGRGIAAALASADRPVVAVARSERELDALAAAHPAIQPEPADATDPAVVATLLDRHRPRALVLVAGARPLVRPLPRHTWETFSANWQTDVRMTFHWVREALLMPLAPGTRVVVVSSGAALQGSPLSGGYAGAKATQRFVAAYAQQEADRDGLGITFTTLLPRITPLTELGAPAVAAYAARAGITEAEYLAPMGPPLTPEGAGAAVDEVLSAPASALAPAYLLTGDGLAALGDRAPV
jgi:NAD(P)-dependent dehydrogenase (short-subunit alcohol dehydrogenase family)